MYNESILQLQYKKLLGLVYGNKERLIKELEYAIKLYQRSPRKGNDNCVSRINFYQSIIDFAKKPEA
jgi:hypothetical protein